MKIVIEGNMKYVIHQNLIARIYLRRTIFFFHNNNIINPVINRINLENNQIQVPLGYFGVVWEMISFIHSPNNQNRTGSILTKFVWQQWQRRDIIIILKIAPSITI